MDKGGSVVPQNVHSDCTCTHVYKTQLTNRACMVTCDAYECA